VNRFRSFAVTDPGRVRSMNQDIALATDNLVAVADGMGGHAAGEVAARIAIDALTESFDASRGPRSLTDAMLRANRDVYGEAEQRRELRGMGTTLTAAALVEERGFEQLVLANVGDSRAYLFDGDELVQLTEDHSLVEQLVRQGELTAEEAAVHPHRHILTRAVGIDPGVEVDSWVLEPRPGMRLLICSDGLTNECSEEEIATVLRDRPAPADAANELVRRALAHGGNDNITVVVGDIYDDDSSPLSTTGDEEVTGNVVRAREGAPARRRAAPLRSATAEHIVTPRVVAFVLVLVAMLGGIAGFTVWFNRATYFVGIDNGNIAIFEGRPGGMLWFRPTLVERSDLAVSSVADANISALQQGVLESSYDAAAKVVANLTGGGELPGVAPVVTTATAWTTPATVATTPPPTTLPPTTTPPTTAARTKPTGPPTTRKG